VEKDGKARCSAVHTAGKGKEQQESGGGGNGCVMRSSAMHMEGKKEEKKEGEGGVEGWCDEGTALCTQQEKQEGWREAGMDLWRLSLVNIHSSATIHFWPQNKI
jgi:hypothetical protein